MGFMENQITDKQQWAEVETNCGTEFVPLTQLGIKLPNIDKYGDEAMYLVDCTYLLMDYLEGNHIQSIPERAREGYGARRSAPGYMDCTEWTVFDTEEEAIEYLEDTYGDDDE